jgi:hypothetical protein
MKSDHLGRCAVSVMCPHCRLAGMTLLTILASMGVAAAQDTAPLRAERNDDFVTILRGSQPVLRYRHGNVPYKPYADRFYSPSGRNVLLDAPPDHAHHHALMFAVAVEGVDFWAEFPDRSPGVQRQSDLQVQAGPSTTKPARVAIRQLLSWRTEDGSKLMTEERVITVFDPNSVSASLLTWQSTLAPAQNRTAVTLSGSHYFGLGMRFIESMNQVGTFFNSQHDPGELVRGGERLVRAAWCALRAPAAAGPVTVAVLDHPDNARHPATHFTMPAPFAYMSATLNVWKQPLQLSAEKPLRLRYGVAIWDGEVPADRVEQLYRRWVELTGEAEGR